MSWHTVRLSEVAEIERQAIAAETIATGTRYLGLEHIEAGGRILSAGTVDAGELASTKFRFGPRHILYGKLRPYLAKIATPDFDGICSTDILPILPGPRIDRGYLTHHLRQPSMIAYASSRAEGANLPRLSPTALACFEVPLPPLPEQRRIAAILDAADVLRAKRRAALAKLDTLAQSIFIEMLGDPRANPKKWPTVELSKLIIDGPQNGLYKPSSDYGTGTLILRIDAFYDGAITKLDSLKRVRLSEGEIETYALSPGDIVINRVNSREFLGKSAIVPELSEPVVFESNMMRFRVDRQKALPEFIIQFLQTKFIRSQIAANTKDAVNQSSINQKDVRSFAIRLPPPTEQSRFVRATEKILPLSESMASGLAAANALFASLQHRAFSGGL